MRRLIINEPGCFIGAKEERVLVKKDGKAIAEIPVAQLSHVLICTKGASLSAAALRLLLKNGVQLIILNGRGKPLGRLLPLIRKGMRVVEEQIKALNDGRGLELAKAFAEAKILNQYSLLKSMAYNREDNKPKLANELHEAAYKVKRYVEKLLEVKGELERVRGELIRLEAEVAEIYWIMVAKSFEGVIEFPGRKKRFENPIDPLNLLLNYGYGVLASHCTLALELSSLDPYRGFLHINTPRRPALTMDFMEEFRQPIVDRVVFRMVRERPKDIVKDGELTKDIRKLLLLKLEERLKERVTFKNRSAPIEAHMLLQAQRIKGYLLGYEPTYTGYVER
ncbi:MAG: CRISPR-associated endonuclease Cas1 [Nitrososphaerales archaeon]